MKYLKDKLSQLKTFGSCNLSVIKLSDNLTIGLKIVSTILLYTNVSLPH